MTAGAPLVDEITKALDCMTICPPRVAQGPVAWAVEGTRPWRAGTRAAINARAALFERVMGGLPRWSVSAIGADVACVRHPFGGPAEAAAARLAAEAGIVTLPGSFFGSGQDDYLRFAFANVDEEQIRAISGRLAGLQAA